MWTGVVPASPARRRTTRRNVSLLTDRQHQPTRQHRNRATAQRKPEMMEDAFPPRPAPCCPRCDLGGKRFDKGLSRACHVAAAESMFLQAQMNGPTERWQGERLSFVSAVLFATPLAACQAGRPTQVEMRHDPQSARLSAHRAHNQPVGVHARNETRATASPSPMLPAKPTRTAPSASQSPGSMPSAWWTNWPP